MEKTKISYLEKVERDTLLNFYSVSKLISSINLSSCQPTWNRSLFCFSLSLFVFYIFQFNLECSQKNVIINLCTTCYNTYFFSCFLFFCFSQFIQYFFCIINKMLHASLENNIISLFANLIRRVRFLRQVTLGCVISRCQNVTPEIKSFV